MDLIEHQFHLDVKQTRTTKNSTIYFGRNKDTNKKVVIKQLCKETQVVWIQRNDKQVCKEAHILNLIKNEPGCCKLLKQIEDDKYLYFVLDTPDRGADLFSYIESSNNTLSEAEVQHIFKQVLEVVHRLFTKLNIIHGDLKDENIVIDLDSKLIKLIDFGGSDIVIKGTTHYRTLCQGTLFYLPPEWFLYGYYEDQSSTVWALGVLLYNLLLGKDPFYFQKDDKNIDKYQIILDFEPLRRTPNISKKTRNCVTSCLSYGSETRITLEDLKKKFG